MTINAPELIGTLDVLENIEKEFTNAQLPEPVFTTYFLNHFKNKGETKDNPLLTVKWLEISGGPYNEVDIVGPDGSVLYTVPGIAVQPVLNPTIQKESFSDINANYELEKNYMPTRGEAQLNHDLNRVKSYIEPDYEKIKENQQRWKSILERYEEKPKDKDIASKLNEDFGIIYE